MDIPELDNIREYVEIPPMFRSDLTGEPIDRCLVCERFLLDDGVQYLIEKAYKQRPQFHSREIIFEYAVCLDCHAEMRSSFSEESLVRIDAYFNRHVNLAKRRAQLLKTEGLNLERWVSSCVINGTPVEAMNEYQMLCQCDGKNLLFAYLPYTLGGEAMDELMQLLSNKTLDQLDGFVEQYFGLPPEFRETPINRLLFV